MTTRTASLEADLATSPIVNAVEQTAVAIPPSSVDGVAYRMRVEVHGVVITRAFDPVLELP